MSVEELQAQILDFEEQLALVNEALKEDPSQPEVLKVKRDLVEVLNVTKDLLKLQKETAPKPVYDNIQEIAAKSGFYVGMNCEAVWPEDNQWYTAVITGISPNGFDVKYTEYGNLATVGPDAIRELKQVQVVYVDATKSQQTSSKTATKTTLVIDKRSGVLILPPSLKVLPTDPEPLKKQKQKTRKAIKNEFRKLKSEEERNKRKGSWQDFQTKKKARTSSSIFKSPDSVTGKVGVVGSGQGMTGYSVQKYNPKKLQSALPVAPVKQ